MVGASRILELGGQWGGHRFEGGHTLRHARLAPIFDVPEVELKYSVRLCWLVIIGDAPPRCNMIYNNV